MELDFIDRECFDFIQLHLLPIINNIGEPLEGNIYMEHLTNTFTRSNDFYEKRLNLITVASQHNINNVLEIGFNAGFSTLLILLTNPDIRITCVDICSHQYTIPCYQKLREIFGNRIELISGSSVDILPILIQKVNSEEIDKYDLIHIDGCHLTEIAEKDIQNCSHLWKSGSLVIFDDYDHINLKPLWNKYIKIYNLQEPNIQLHSTLFHSIKKIL
jgi:predicted O-methyltransferase YrrM